MWVAGHVAVAPADTFMPQDSVALMECRMQSSLLTHHEVARVDVPVEVADFEVFAAGGPVVEGLAACSCGKQGFGF